jgi:hypothetical protein
MIKKNHSLVPDLTIGANTIESRNLLLVAAVGLSAETESEGKGELSRGRFEGIRDVDAKVDAIIYLVMVNKLGRWECRRPGSIARAGPPKSTGQL